MTSSAGVLLAAALVVAVANWWSRLRHGRRLELVTKPAVTALLALAAVALDPADPAMRWWFVAALVACLVGDIALLGGDRWFVVGLGAFLVGHALFVAGFVAGGLDHWALAAAALVVVVVMLAIVGRPVLAGARRRDARLGGPVLAYFVVISAMVVVAAAHGDGWGIAGALAFYGSDAVLGWDRFVAPRPWAPVTIMATYHLALLGLVLALS